VIPGGEVQINVRSLCEHQLKELCGAASIKFLIRPATITCNLSMSPRASPATQGFAGGSFDFTGGEGWKKAIHPHGSIISDGKHDITFLVRSGKADDLELSPPAAG